jgi:hypothetical protein
MADQAHLQPEGTMSQPLARNRWKSCYGYDNGLMNQSWRLLGHPLGLWGKIAWKAGGIVTKAFVESVHPNCRKET